MQGRRVVLNPVERNVCATGGGYRNFDLAVRYRTHTFSFEHSLRTPSRSCHPAP